MAKPSTTKPEPLFGEDQVPTLNTPFPAHSPRHQAHSSRLYRVQDVLLWRRRPPKQTHGELHRSNRSLRCAGKTYAEAESELKSKGLAQDEIDTLTPFKVFDNQPTNTLLIDALTPESVGKLIAICIKRSLFKEYCGIFSAMTNGV